MEQNQLEQWQIELLAKRAINVEKQNTKPEPKEQEEKENVQVQR